MKKNKDLIEDDIVEIEPTNRLENANNAFEGKWFVINCNSGKEEIIKNNLEQKIKSLKLADKIFDIRIVKEKYRRKRDSKWTERNSYPGYVFINMIMNDELWYHVRNTDEVTGFLGSSGSGAKPLPLSRTEIFKMLDDGSKPKNKDSKNKHEADFKINDYVKIIGTAFNDKEGKVVEMDYSKGLATIEIEFLGNSIPSKVPFKNCKQVIENK